MEAATHTRFHQAINAIAKEGRLLRFYTQNIDDLEFQGDKLVRQIPIPEKGPWTNTIQIHGSMHVMACRNCKAFKKIDVSLFRGERPPACPKCELPRLKRNGSPNRNATPGALRPRLQFYDDFIGWDQVGLVKVMDADLKKRADTFIIAGTALSVKAVKDFAMHMCRQVHTRKNGINIWVSLQLPPSDIKPLLDIIVLGTCDQLAEHVGY